MLLKKSKVLISYQSTGLSHCAKICQNAPNERNRWNVQETSEILIIENNAFENTNIVPSNK